MDTVQIGINLEFIRHSGKNFDEALLTAKRCGYDIVEPFVFTSFRKKINTHLTILSHREYHHIDATEDSIENVRDKFQNLGLKLSGFSCHCQLISPSFGPTSLIPAIEWASALNAPVVNTDEGQMPEWMTPEEGLQLIEISLRPILKACAKNKVMLGIEPHGILTTKAEYLGRILAMGDPNWLKVNFDTGNAFLAGSDPIGMLESVIDRVVHIHAKDIPREQAEAERGKVTSTPMGVAVGEGVIDFEGIVKVLKENNFTGTISVECATEEQAVRSLRYLTSLI
jgi:inosose dehydratase